MILHVAVHVKGRVGDGLNAHSHMALLYIHHGFLHGLRHFQLLQDDWQSATTESSYIHFFYTFQALARGYHGHVKEFPD